MNEEQKEQQKDVNREKKHWRNMMDNQFAVSPSIMWVVGIVFAVGGAYMLISRIPSIEKKQEVMCLQINTLEVNYTSIEKLLEKIDRKLDRGSNRGN